MNPIRPLASRVITLALNPNKILLTLLLGCGMTLTAYSQGDIPSGTVSGSGSGPYTYSLTFSDAAGATGPIGSVWYAWVPGFFYLPGTPTGASAPAGWTASISGNSIMFSANSSASYITAGSSLSGFSYTATFSPSTLASTPNSGRSDAYMAGIESDAGVIFNVTASGTPEPTSATLLLLGAAGWGLWGRRRVRAGV